MQGVVKGGEQGTVRQDPTCSREHQPGDVGDQGGGSQRGTGFTFVPLPWRGEESVSPCRVGGGLAGPLLPATEVTGGRKANAAAVPPALPGALGMSQTPSVLPPAGRAC